jgi:sodium transport system ATP-binding protein
LYQRLTAREQIRYYGRLHGLAGAALERRIDELSEQLGMADIIDRRAKGFSRGQTLKLGLARALVHDPRNILFDEPTNGLDIASSRAVRSLLRDLKARGRAILFCSHILQEVAALCDRLLVLGHGRVVAQGSVTELCAATGKTDLEEALLVLTRAHREAA